jgi:hypothetical protein
MAYTDEEREIKAARNKQLCELQISTRKEREQIEKDLKQEFDKILEIFNEKYKERFVCSLEDCCCCGGILIWDYESYLERNR